MLNVTRSKTSIFCRAIMKGENTFRGACWGGGGGISRRGVQKVSPHPLRSNCIHCFCSLVNKFTIDYYFILLCHFADKDRLFGFLIRRGELIRKLSFLELDLKKIHYRVFSQVFRFILIRLMERKVSQNYNQVFMRRQGMYFTSYRDWPT